MTGNDLELRRRVAAVRRRTPRWAAICVVLAVLLSAGAASATSAEGSGAQTSVPIAFLPVEPVMQAAYAEAKGFFARQGIDAELKVVSDPSLIPAAVLSGEVRFAAFNIGGLANLKARNIPVKLIASGALYRPTAPTTALVAAPGKTIARARGLVGKRIAIDRRTTVAHIGLLTWLKRNGVSADHVTLVELGGFAAMLGPLRRGQVDAAVLPEPYLTQAVRRGSRRIATIFDAVCAKDCLITAWIARKDVDPVLAARFRNAIQAAGLWANQKRNQPASAAIVAEHTGIDAAVTRKTTRTTYSTRLRPVQAQPWIDVYAEFGVIPKSFKAIDLVK
jgi:NitT/TauT family transport system substrate-binding protein